MASASWASTERSAPAGDSATARPGSVRGATPVLAATKLHIPALRPRRVRRPRLVSLLAGGAQCRLTIIAASAGSGKTTLLSEWHEAGETRRFSWISLDAADNDPGRFWDGVLAALRTFDRDIGAVAQAALHSPGTTVEDHVLPLLINDLAAMHTAIVLVLDDYHVIENDQIHGAVELLIERLPANAQLVIATRSDPALPLSRLRARGQLNELRAADLRFSVSEAAAFLNDVVGLRLDEEEVARLHDRTEGWAAGLQLAGLSLKGRDDHRQFIASFAGDDHQIVDYLGLEVLDRQTAEVREFLLRSSILDRLSGPLCAAVTGIDDAGRLLHRLERENAFVVALDSRREWYRYHHLFAEVLHHELGRTRPELGPELHRRASAWYGQAGAIDEAIEHATAAGDHVEAIGLITAHWYEFLQRGRHETVATWIDRLPDETVRGDPNLCLTNAWLGVNMGRLDDVDRWIETAAAANRDRDDELSPLASAIASLRAIHRYMDGDVSGAVAAGRHALELERGGAPSPWRPVGCPVLGLALHWHGHSGDAQHTLTEAVRIAKAGGNHLAAMHATGGLAAIEYHRADTAAAAAHAADAIALAEEHELAEHWASSLALSVRGQLLEQAGELEAAEAVLRRAAELARRGIASIEIAYALVTLATARHRLGRLDDAGRIQAEARAVVARCLDAGILNATLKRSGQRLQATNPHASSRVAASGCSLSEAELTVLRLLRGQLSQREIARELQLSFNTIKTHTRNIYRKLGVSGRDDAVGRAHELGLI